MKVTVGDLKQKRRDINRLIREAERIAGALGQDKSYFTERDRIGAIRNQQSASARDIGEIPAVVNPQRRDACERDFRLFCESYLPLVFYLPWSPDHLKAIAKIQAAILSGGLYAFAMPRGDGKTALCEAAVLWALLYGHRAFVCLIGAESGSAAEMLQSVRHELETPDSLIAEDFPEVCVPFIRLERITQRRLLHRGKTIILSLCADEVVLPDIEGSKAAGAIVRAVGLTARIRGMKYKRADGQSVRPDLVIIDDPQTDESAKSVTQCAHRERLLSGAVLGLAGPGKKISGIMPCTVVRYGDLSDNILDRGKHPDWQGERTRMVYEWPKRQDLWDRYAEIRAESLRMDGDGSEATEFYSEHRAEMDDGGRIAWEARHNPDELSAIQHAVNLRLRAPKEFDAEYQNEPQPETLPDQDELTIDIVLNKTSGLARRVFPAEANVVTAFIDVQKECLFFGVMPWEPEFTGYLIDYGTWPDQKRPYFNYRDIRRTLALEFPKMTLPGRIYAGLEALCDEILGKAWVRDDGQELRVDRCLIDANWGLSTHVVKKFCRQSKHSAILLPSHGRYVGASTRPMDQWRKEKGEQCGLNWRIRKGTDGTRIRHIVWDTNFWKSATARGFKTAQGDKGCISIWGSPDTNHQMLAEHCAAEFCVKTHGRDRDVDEWALRPSRDNHLWDVVVGCAVAASTKGIIDTSSLGSAFKPKPTRRRQRVSYLT